MWPFVRVYFELFNRFNLRAVARFAGVDWKMSDYLDEEARESDAEEELFENERCRLKRIQAESDEDDGKICTHFAGILTFC